MNRLVFAIAALQPLIDHARAAPSSRPILEDCFVEPGADPVHLKPGATPDEDGFVDSTHVDVSKLPKGLLLVKDHGAYVMSGGNPPLLKTGEGKVHEVVYANGCDPKADPEWYDDVKAICGGDDFVMRLELQDLDNLLANFAHNNGRTATRFQVAFADEQVILEVC